MILESTKAQPDKDLALKNELFIYNFFFYKIEWNKSTYNHATLQTDKHIVLSNIRKLIYPKGKNVLDDIVSNIIPFC